MSEPGIALTTPALLDSCLRGTKMPKVTRIRQLRDGELPPPGRPRGRYRSTKGYVRLRWSDGPMSLVECYEHRAVMGFPPAKYQVHHINGVRDDNRPENLEVVSPAEHGRRHRVHDRQSVVDLYATGISTIEVGRSLGVDPSWVWRVLTAEGVEIRPGTTYITLDLDEELIRRLHTAGVRSRRIADALRVSPVAIDARVKAMGLTPHRDGRPTNAEIASARAALEVEGL